MRDRQQDRMKEALEGELRRMWRLLEEGTPKHLYSTIRRLQQGAKPAA
jgi:hypothetical protein